MRSVIERAVALAALVVLSPVLVVVAAVVRVALGSPVLFAQVRTGRHDVPFTLRKFRTMSDARDPATGELLPDADRLGRVGRFLRSSSLDELPELWNVVRGEMRLVGPRPLPVHYLPRYLPSERARHRVHPGITGWAQINGRNTVDWTDRLALDVWYVEHRSLRLDLEILARTLGAVVRREGVSAEGEATMSELPPDRQG